MITLRPAAARGHADHGWLRTWHSFSFAEYYDAEHVSFSSLRVLNEDRIAPGAGFPPHPHRDMEIVTYVLSGALAHRDSMGHGSTIHPGEVQRMSAGTGVVHSERNASDSDELHLLQIWILPARSGLEPGYEQKAFADAELRGRLRLVAAADGRSGAVTVHQDASLFVGRLDTGESVRHELAPGRRAYVHVARGALQLGGRPLGAGDGARVQGESALVLSAAEAADVLVFDLA